MYKCFEKQLPNQINFIENIMIDGLGALMIFETIIIWDNKR